MHSSCMALSWEMKVFPFSCFLDGNVSPTLLLSEGLAFKNNHSYYYSTIQSGNSKIHTE